MDRLGLFGPPIHEYFERHCLERRADDAAANNLIAASPEYVLPSDDGIGEQADTLAEVIRFLDGDRSSLAPLPVFGDGDTPEADVTTSEVC